MKRWELAAACALDATLGDPRGLPHPVRWIGGFAAALERVAFARVDPRAPLAGFAAGAALAAIVAGLAAAGAGGLARTGAPTRIVLAAAALAGRDLDREVNGVEDALLAGDLPRARERVARIVGRDTHHLDAPEIVRATLETAAESLCDGVIAPLLALRAGGVTAAWCFKAISTLDSAIGHIEPPYTYFGRAAARADDALNFIPARVTTAAIAVAATLSGADARAALRTAARDAGLHRSPNAGWCEAALAGALHVTLGGDNRYAGVLVAGPRFGAEYPPPAIADIARARRLLRVAAGVVATALVVTARS